MPNRFDPMKHYLKTAAEQRDYVDGTQRRATCESPLVQDARASVALDHGKRESALEFILHHTQAEEIVIKTYHGRLFLCQARGGYVKSSDYYCFYKDAVRDSLNDTIIACALAAGWPG